MPEREGTGSPESKEGVFRTTVLIADRNIARSRALANQLNDCGFSAAIVENDEKLLNTVSGLWAPDVLVMDTDFSPRLTVADIHQIRKTPIIAVSENQGSRAEIRALASGADHYLTMPLDPDVLAVRINASLRARSESAGKQSEGTLKVGNLEIDLDKKFAKKEGTIIPLTKTEWKVLLFLAQKRLSIADHHQTLPH